MAGSRRDPAPPLPGSVTPVSALYTRPGAGTPATARFLAWRWTPRAGSHLASAATVLSVPLPRAARSSQLRIVGTAFLRRRPLVVAPMMGLTLVLMTAAGTPLPQRIALAGGFTVLLSFFSWEAHRAKTSLLDETELHRSLLLTSCGIFVANVATGGTESPLIPMFFAPAVTAFSAFGRSRESAQTLALFVTMLFALGLLPRGIPFPPIPSPQREIILVGSMLTAIVLLRIGVASLSDAYADASGTVLRMREAVLEEAEGRARALEQVGAKVAHEIKNPLSSIRGLVELLAEDATDERARRRCDVVGKEIVRIEAILKDYLSFARPLEELRPGPVSVGDLAREVLSVVEARAERSGLSLSAEGPEETISADGRRLTQALLNLCSNALEATRPGGLIEVTWKRVDDAVELRIRDTGKGMDADVLRRAGTPFFTTRDEGTGLGIVLARSVIEAHGGSLSFESEPGDGTSAIVKLPRGTIEDR
jgi:signal transduction histidine kinase